MLLFLRAKVDFVDIDENTFNIDVNLLEAKLGEASKKIYQNCLCSFGAVTRPKENL